jgi:GTP cyclohydrolase II
MKLMSAPLHFNALSGFNLNVSEFVAAPPQSN